MTKPPETQNADTKSWAEMPMYTGPETDVEAFKAEVQEVVKGLFMANEGRPSPAVMEAAVRKVCQKHGVRCGDMLDVAKLHGSLRPIVQHAGAFTTLRLAREEAGPKRWTLTDGRWVLFVTQAEVVMLVGAGVQTIDRGVPEFARLRSDERVDLHRLSDEDLVELLASVGVRQHAKEDTGMHPAAVVLPTNSFQVRLAGVVVAADIPVLLALRGATHTIVDLESRLIEGRNERGKSVGFGLGMRDDQTAVARDDSAAPD